VHTVPAVGYAVSAAAGSQKLNITGVTERNRRFGITSIINVMLVIETAFGNRERTAKAHVSPDSLPLSWVHYRQWLSHLYPTYTTSRD
jgi:hypothetical protein